MSRPANLLSIGVLLLAFAATPAVAQYDGAGAHQLILGAGVLHSSERDASASPLLYSGNGLDLLGGYVHAPPHSRTEVHVRAARYTLTSSGEATLHASADQEQYNGELSHLRRIGRAASRVQLFVGGSLASTVVLRTQHVFNGETRGYLSYVFSAAPTVRAELALPSAHTVTYQLAVPLFTGVTHAYSDTHLLDDPSSRRPVWTGPGGYRELEQSMSLTVPVTAHAGIRTTMLLDLFDCTRDPQLAGSRANLTVAMMLWTSGRSRDGQP